MAAVEPSVPCLPDGTASNCTHPSPAKTAEIPPRCDWLNFEEWLGHTELPLEAPTSLFSVSEEDKASLEALDRPKLDDGGHTPGLNEAAEGTFPNFTSAAELDAYEWPTFLWPNDLASGGSSEKPSHSEDFTSPTCIALNVPGIAPGLTRQHLSAFCQVSNTLPLLSPAQDLAPQTSIDSKSAGAVAPLPAIRALSTESGSPDGFEIDGFDHESAPSSPLGVEWIDATTSGRKRTAEEANLPGRNETKRPQQSHQIGKKTARTTPAAGPSRQTMMPGSSAEDQPFTKVPEGAKSQAGKVAVACFECQARKSKCSGDGTDACQRCLSKNIACQYPDTQRKRGRGRKNIERELGAARDGYSQLLQQFEMGLAPSDARELEQKRANVEHLEVELRQCTGTGTHRARTSAPSSSKGKQRSVSSRQS